MEIEMGFWNALKTIGKSITDEIIPNAAFMATKETERLYQSGKLPSNRHAEHLESRRKGVTQGQAYLNHLCNKLIPREWTSKELANHIEILENSCNRLEWFTNLPNLSINNSTLENAKKTLETAKENIQELKTIRREKSNFENKISEIDSEIIKIKNKIKEHQREIEIELEKLKKNENRENLNTASIDQKIPTEIQVSIDSIKDKISNSEKKLEHLTEERRLLHACQ